jgi:hypothetical protein
MFEKLKMALLILKMLLIREVKHFEEWYTTEFLPKFPFKALMLNNAAMVGRGGGSSAGSKIAEWIGLVISLIFGVALVPTVVDTIAGTNYTNWTFTGASGAKVLYGLLPFIFICGLIVYFVLRLIGKI